MIARLREWIRDARGSVMMEFIIVMPIYLVLFGVTCAVGDILVHSGRLLSADRFSAFFADEKNQVAVKDWVMTMFRQPNGNVEMAANGRELNDLTIDSDWHYAEPSAPWSVCAAAKTTDRFYIAAGGGLAQVLAGKHWIETGTGRTDTGDFWADFGRSGYKTLYSRSGVQLGTYARSFYVLKRKKYFDRNGNPVKTWRDVPESSLLTRWGTRDGGSAWRDEVYDEAWFDAHSIGDNGVKSAKSCPEANAWPYWYDRYGTFVTWSN